MELRDVVFEYSLVEDTRIAWHGRFHRHESDEYEAVFFIDGSGTFLIAGVNYPIAPGRFFLNSGNEYHQIIPGRSSPHPVSYYAVLFKVDESDERLTALLEGLLSRCGRCINANVGLRFQCADIEDCFNSKDDALKKAAEYGFLALLFRVYHEVIVENFPSFLPRKNDNAPPPPSFYAPLPKKITSSIRNDSMEAVHIKKALAIMENGVQKNMAVEDIARQLDLSPEYFNRIFSAFVKMTPHQYFMRLKIEGAAGMLISTNKKIEEIAWHFGFKNACHFSRVFKSYTAVSPQGYRKIYLQTVDWSGAAGTQFPA